MLGQGRYAFIFVGDVTGHGLSATLLSSADSGCIGSVFYGMADERNLTLLSQSRRSSG